MSAKIVAFLNFKGGVGKTANVVNLGASLSYIRKKRVLVVDLDPQCNATYWLLRRPEFERLTDSAREESGVQHTTYQIFQDAIQGISRFKPKNAIIQGVPRSESGTELIPLLHLLPGAVDLLDIEFAVTHKIAERFRPSLRQALAPFAENYDYILLDCPPNLYHVAQTAILAAQHIVVPYNPDYLSLSGFRILCCHLKKLEDAFQSIRPKFKRNQVCALIVNRYQKVGVPYTAAISELKSQIDVLKQNGLVHPKCEMLEPPIRQDVRIAESTSEHKPIIIHDADCNGSKDYCELADAFTRHFEENL